MALLTNINGKFSVSDAGAVTFNNAFTFPTTDGAANYVLQTNGSGQLAWALNGNGDISGSGTANTVTKFTGAKTIGNGPITFSGNESTFTGRISVTGDISADNYINIEGATNPYLRIQDITNEEYLNLYSSDNESAIVYTQDTFKISSGVDFLNQTPRLTINSSGNATFAGSVSAEDNIYLTDAGTTRAKLLLNASDRDNVELRAESLGSTMKFFTVGTEALELDASQNATFAGNLNLPADKYILIGTDSGDAFNPSSAIRIQDSSHAYVQMKVGNSSQGGVLIGNTTDDYLGGFTYSNSSESLVFKTANTDALTITGAGNATFVGTVTAPTFSGDLNGTINTVTTATTKGNSTNDTTVATTAFVQNVVGTIPAGLVFQGTWNASTNSPTLTSGSGTTGHFYIVSVAGSTNLDGITDWQVGDWAVFIEQGASDQWEKIDNSSVLGGSGTGGSFAGWSGSGTSVTLGNAPVTFSGNDSTFAGKITASTLSIQNQINTTSSNLEINYANGDGTTTNFKDFYVRDGKNAVILNIQGSSKNATFAGTITSTSTSTNTLAGKLRINGTTTTGLEIASSSGSSSGLKLYNDSSNDHAYILNHYNGNLALGTNNAAVITLNGTTATFAGKIGIPDGSDVFWGGGYGNGAPVLAANGTTMKMYPSGSTSGIQFSLSPTVAAFFGNVGIGTASPQSKLHIETGSGGTYSPNVNHDDVTIEGSGNIGLQLFSPATSYQYIAFGDPGSVNAGYLRYYHGTNEMVFRTNGSDNMVINSAGNVGIGVTGPTSELHVSGSGTVLTLQGSGTDVNALFKNSLSDNYLEFFNGVYNVYQAGGSAGNITLKITDAGAVTFPKYSGTLQTGTPTYLLGTDASGNVVKTLTTPSPVTSQAASLYDLIPNGAFTTTYAFTSTAGTYAEVMKGDDIITDTGTYTVQAVVNDFAVGGTQYDVKYSGVMSWHAGTTNDSGQGTESEIVLHRNGHASNQGIIYLRTRETVSAEGNELRLEIMCNRTYTSASNVVFKFVRLI